MPGSPGRAEGEQGEAEPAGGAGALLQGEPPVHRAGPLLQPAVDDRQPLLGDALLRTEGLGGAEQPGQRALDVAGRDQPHARDGRARGVQVDVGRRRRGPRRRRRAAVGEVAPSAASSPAPPSLVPLPPSPTTTVVAPAVDGGPRPARRRRTSSPARRPRRRSGAGRTPGRSRRTRCRRPGSTVAGTGSPSGPRTVHASSSPPSAACSTSTNPGPPSDIGARSSSSSGACRAQPAAIASAASTAVSVPANLSGATRTRMRRSCLRLRWAAWVTGRSGRCGPRTSPAAERLSDESFYELDVRDRRGDWPPPDAARSDRQRAVWTQRTRALRRAPTPAAAGSPRTTPAWSASPRRSGASSMWCLATYAVRPGRQGRGIGRPLLDAALHHGRGCLRGDAVGLVGPQGGAALPPGRASSCTRRCSCRAPVDRTAIPVVEKVREGTAADIELMDSLDRRTRGAAHGAGPRAHAAHLAAARLRHDDRLAATPTSTSAASSPCWRPATGVRPPGCCGPRWPTARTSRWSPTSPAPTSGRIDVGLAARLDLRPGGLSRAARDETARAVRSQRCPALTLPRMVAMTTVDLPLLPLGRGVDLRSERGVECPGDLPVAVRPRPGRARPRGQGGARRPGVRARATTTSATRSSSSPTSPATRSSSPARRRPARRPSSSSSAASTSWPSRPTSSPRPTRR